MIKPKITKKLFDEIPSGDIVSVGVTTNDPQGIFATRECLHRLLLWVMVKGYMNDWAIYYHWADVHTIQEVRENGDKLYTESYIENIIDLDKELMENFRS